jgi:DNA-binding MarR family transcriptional regulator
VTPHRPLRFDPIEEASRNWHRAGWGDAAAGMTLVTSIMRAHQILLSRVDATLVPFGLTFARFEVLMLLDFSRTGRLPLSKIGERLQVHPASVTNAINRLQRDGFVARLEHPTDRRTTLAAITRSGRRVVRNAAKALNEGAFGDPGLDRDQIDTVVRVLAELRRDAKDFEPSPAADAVAGARDDLAVDDGGAGDGARR